ncbi:MAG TPA: hypothetical protein VFD70_18900 [Anaerolineae bacterium]|nr:hypothetical protein [Anaerolineae bacterium]
MKYFIAIFVLGALLLGLFVSTPTAWARPAFEDPQLCINDKLLIVEPTTAPVVVWVSVGRNVSVDFNVENCGGDPNLPVIEEDHVRFNGEKSKADIVVLTAPKTKVNFEYGDKSKTQKSDKFGLIDVEFKAK